MNTATKPDEAFRQAVEEARGEGSGNALPPREDDTGSHKPASPPRNKGGRPRGSKTRKRRGGASTRGAGGRFASAGGQGEKGTSGEAVASVEGPPPPVVIPPEVVRMWAGMVRAIDANAIAPTLRTTPLSPEEAEEGGRAVAIVVDYYFPRMMVAAGPWGPFYAWVLTAYGPRAIEALDRMAREWNERRKQKRLTAAEHAADETGRARREAAPDASFSGPVGSFTGPRDVATDNPPGYVEVPRRTVG